MTTILVIPDTQIKPDVPLDHLEWLGQYIVDKRPDYIVHLGDLADMASLSSYDKGKKAFEGRRYKKDVESAILGQYKLLDPLARLQDRQEQNKKKIYKPKQILTLGNHCERINRAVNLSPELDGVLNVSDLKYEEFGWEVHPFLDVVTINGIAFSHYFLTGTAGRPASTANAQLSKQHMSCVSGHQQGFFCANGIRADGAQLTSIICGSFYLHNEEYLGPQGNNHFRGALMLYPDNKGGFTFSQLPMRYLKARYG